MSIIKDFYFDPDYVYILLWGYDFELSDTMVDYLNLNTSSEYDEFENLYHKPEHFDMRFDKNVISLILYPEKIDGESESEFHARKGFQHLVKKIDKKIYEKKYYYIRDFTLGERIEYNKEAIKLDEKFELFCDKIKLLLNLNNPDLLHMFMSNKLTPNNFEDIFELLPGVGKEFIKAQEDFDKLK
jgi:hypothetical protein